MTQVFIHLRLITTPESGVFLFLFFVFCFCFVFEVNQVTFFERNWCVVVYHDWVVWAAKYENE